MFHGLLEQKSNRIFNEIASAPRVTYDVSSKLAATIEWE
jgi:GMP synthase PP-ATPase subunit